MTISHSSQPMAIRATFHDIRPIKGRKLAQLVFEIPVEQADEALAALGGYPRPDHERWCGIALLDPANFSEPSSTPQRRPFHELSMTQQAAIKCTDQEFQKFMSTANEHDCANAVRVRCGVKTRADIKPDTSAGDCWVRLLADYEHDAYAT